MILAGDIGGTHTRLSLFDKDRNSEEEKKFSSPSYKSLIEIVEEFLQKQKVEVAVFGIAGPVKNNQCRATNLPWIVDGNKISKHFKIPKVFLINDLLANAYGLRTLKEDELFVLQKGEKIDGNQALVSAGTGLGEAGLVWDGKDHIPFACEGGHCDFAARNEEEFALFQFLDKKYGHVSYERLVSGQGISNIYQFLTEVKKMDPLPGEDISPKKITDAATKKQSDTALQTMEWFFSFYGAEAGNTALKFLSLSGLFLGGGIMPKVVSLVEDSPFIDSFVKKGRFEELLCKIPIKVVLKEKTALLGALEYALLQI